MIKYLLMLALLTSWYEYQKQVPEYEDYIIDCSDEIEDD